jgi:hypothetical protein
MILANSQSPRADVALAREARADRSIFQSFVKPFSNCHGPGAQENREIGSYRSDWAAALHTTALAVFVSAQWWPKGLGR